MDKDLVKLASDIVDWYSMDMGTWFDEIQGNEEEVFNETLGYLENNDVEMIQHFIDDMSLEKGEVDDDEITSTSKDLVSRLKKLLNKSSVNEGKESARLTGDETYVARNSSGYKSIGLIVDNTNKQFQIINGQVMTTDSKTKKMSKKQIRDKAQQLYDNGYTEYDGYGSVAKGVDKKTESKKLKKESPTDDAVYSFFDQMDKYMDSKGTDMEALKGIESTANNVYKFRPEFTDMRYGDMYRALSKEYVRENKLTEAQIDNLNTLYEVFKIENYNGGKLEEGFTLDDEETKFINNMVNKDKADIEDFLGYDLTDELFNDKQHLRLAIKEIYEQMPEEELSKFEEDYSKTKIQDVIRAGEELWGDDARVYETRVAGIYNCDTARHGGYLVDTNVFPELAKYGDKTSIDNIVGFEEDYEALKVIWVVPEVLEQIQLNNNWYKDLTLDKVLHYEDSLNDDFRKEFPNKKEIAEVPEMKTEAKDEDMENMFINLFNEWESKLTTGIPELNIIEHNPKALLNCIKAEDLQYKFTTKGGADVSVDVELKLEKTTKQFIEVLKREVNTPYVLVCHIINSYSNDTIPAEKSVVGGVIAVEEDGNITSYPLNPQLLTTDIDNCVEWLSGWVNDNIDVLSTAKLENKLKEDKMYKCITESKTTTNRARRLKLEANQEYKSKDERLLGPSEDVISKSKEKGLYTESNEQLSPRMLKNQIVKLAKAKGLTVNNTGREWEVKEGENVILYITPRKIANNQIDRIKLYTTDYKSDKADEFIKTLKDNDLITENKVVEGLIDKPVNFKFDKYQGIVEPNGDITYNIGTSKNRTGNKFNYNDVEDTDFPHTDNQKVKMYIKQNVLKTEGLSKDAEDVIYSVDSFNELLDLLDNMLQTDKVVKARNLVSHTFTHISDEEEDEKLEDIKDEVINILEESKKDDRFQANLSLHSKFGMDTASKLIQELDTALEQNDKQKIKKLANKLKKELSPNDYNSFIKTYYPEYIDVLKCDEMVTENRQYRFDGTDTFPKKIKARGGYEFSKINDGTYENAFLPVYRNDRGDDTLMTQDDFNHCEVLEENKKIEEKYYLVGIYTDEHGMEQKDYIEGAYNKEYLNHYMEEHEEELKDRDYDKMYIEDNDNIGLTESVLKCLDEGYNGWKPDVGLYTKLMKEIRNNLGISEYEIQKEADAIKFRYNGKVYFAEPRSTCQVDIFDDNHKQIGWGVVTNKIKQEVFTDYITNQDFLYQFVGGEYAGTYTREEAEKLPIREPELTDDLDDIRARGGFVHRKELDNQFQFKGYVGPMWNGTKDGKGVIRYETPEVNDMLSR